LSRFCLGHREDFIRELFVRDIFTLEQAYQLISRFFFTRRTDYRNNTNKATTVKSHSSQS